MCVCVCVCVCDTIGQRSVEELFHYKNKNYPRWILEERTPYIAKSEN